MQQATEEGEGGEVALPVDMAEEARGDLHGGLAAREGTGAAPLAGDDHLPARVDISPQPLGILHGCQVLAERIDATPCAGDHQLARLVDEAVLATGITHPSSPRVEAATVTPLTGDDDGAAGIGIADKTVLFDGLKSHGMLVVGCHAMVYRHKDTERYGFQRAPDGKNALISKNI